MDKQGILKTLSAVEKFDTQAASPFIALRLTDAKVYRSSNFGFIASKDMLVDKTSVYVSLDHLSHCLRAMPENNVELALDANGTLIVKSVETPYESELRVHTMKSEDVSKSGMKRHELGNFSGVLKPELFKGFNAKPFNIVAPPLLQGAKLCLSTPQGIVMWQGPDPLRDVKLNPRESYLRFISDGAVEQVFLTDTGYWGATNGPLVIYMSGHNLSPNLHQTYNIPGVKATEFPAARLVSVLASAASLTDSARKVQISPEKGVTAWNEVGDPQEFHVGPQKGWGAFSLFGQAAKLISDALSQGEGDIATLEHLKVGSFPTMRLSRGNWSVAFKVF